MIRLLCIIFHIPYETCKSCETLKEELRFMREENKRLSQCLVDIASPAKKETVQQFVAPAANHPLLFSRRREELERQDRERAAARANSGPLVAKSDIEIKNDVIKKNILSEPVGQTQSIEDLERELGVVNADE